MKKIISIGFMILLGVAPACRKEFTEPVMSRVRFDFDWTALPSGVKPGEGMALRFYGAGGEVYDRETDTAFFDGYLPVGSYRVLLRNHPATGILFRGENRFDTAEAYVVPVSRATETVGQPGWLFAAALTDCEVNEKEETALAVTPEPMVHRITLDVKITSEREIEAVSGRLLNVASALNLSTGRPVPSSISETDIPIERSGDRFGGSVLVFKLLKKEEIPSDAPDKNLRLDIAYTDGGEKRVELDISGQLEDLGDKGGDAEVDVDITPDGIGFEVRIIEWIKGQGPDIPIKR